jgi:hypothetical protein
VSWGIPDGGSGIGAGSIGGRAGGRFGVVLVGVMKEVADAAAGAFGDFAGAFGGADAGVLGADALSNGKELSGNRQLLSLDCVDSSCSRWWSRIPCSGSRSRCGS